MATSHKTIGGICTLSALCYGAACNTVAKANDWDSEGWWFKPQYSHNEKQLGPCAKPLTPHCSLGAARWPTLCLSYNIQATIWEKYPQSNNMISNSNNRTSPHPWWHYMIQACVLMCLLKAHYLRVTQKILCLWAHNFGESKNLNIFLGTVQSLKPPLLSSQISPASHGPALDQRQKLRPCEYYSV